MVTYDSRQTIDMDVLLMRLNNDQDFLKEIIKDFVLDVQAKLLKLKISLLEEDFESIQIIAHTLKGTTSYLATYFLNEAVCKLEQSAKQKDPKKVFAYFKIFENEFTKLISFLKKDNESTFSNRVRA